MRLITLMVVCLLFASCTPRTLYEEKVSMSNMNPIELCIETGVKGDYTGWGQNRAAAAKQLIREQGITCDWAAVEMIKQQRDAAMMAQTPAIMQMLNQNVGYQPVQVAPQPNYNAFTGTTVSPSGAITHQGLGFLSRQTTSGQYRQCYYRNGNVETPVTIALSQICPQKN